ncbi:MAG: hypothetical protein HY777_00140 [Betaproteobacteria bacterium]|nr:hypothetical protein [Betaproteobacteria bacterium]
MRYPHNMTNAFLQRLPARVRRIGTVCLASLVLAFAPQTATAAPFSIDTGGTPMTGLWWNPDESGWGVSLTQNGPSIIAAWFTYDRWGAPIWYLMPNCAVAGNACGGDVYRMDGGTRPTAPWNGRGQVVSQAGAGTFSFSDNDTGVFDYTVDGASGHKNVVRQLFAGSAAAPAADHSGLWGVRDEPGWGVAVSQQGTAIFAAVLTYVASGNPVWYVVPDCVLSENYCAGTLYRTSGGSAPTSPWSGTVAATPVGTLAFEFLDTGNATMRFALDGRSGARSIAKDAFYAAGQLLPSSDTLARQCAAPRPASAIDPLTGRAYGDVQGSVGQETRWIRSFVNESYLWYPEVPPVDPALYMIGASVRYVDPKTNNAGTVTPASDAGVVDAYFNSQRTPAFTASGKPKDPFHFTYATADWVALSNSGTAGGFGFEVALLSASPPRKALVAYTTPGTPAAQNGLQRGAQFLAINDVDVVNGADVSALNEGLFSPVVGKTYSFTVLDPGSATPRTLVMVAANIALSPVLNAGTLPAPDNNVGYLLFNDHIAPAESQLIAAVNQLRTANGGAGIDDLVLDLRYNGGGYLDIASELATMIAGPASTGGKIFEQLRFNDKNPFRLTEAETVTPFLDVAQGFSVAPGQPLPRLGLGRVFVLTGSATCSASESIINGLRGAGVTVVQIGGTTCGKPYGFYPQDNCGTTYFAIQFKGVNHLGFGDYADGFVPGETGTTANSVPGCVASDDFSKALGDPGENRLATALYYRAHGACPAVTRDFGERILRPGEPPDEPVLQRSALRENRFLRRQ